MVRIELSLAERVLVAQGHEDAVNARRQAVEPAVATAMRAAVERTTGRTVATVVADTHLNPDITIFTFTFAPAAAALARGAASEAGEARRGR